MLSGILWCITLTAEDEIVCSVDRDSDVSVLDSDCVGKLSGDVMVWCNRNCHHNACFNVMVSCFVELKLVMVVAVQRMVMTVVARGKVVVVVMVTAERSNDDEFHGEGRAMIIW